MFECFFKLDKKLNNKIVVASEEGEEREVVNKTLEYCARRLNRRYMITKGRKVSEHMTQKGPESKTVAIRAEGKTYAELLH